jgi:ATP synthase protein I
LVVAKIGASTRPFYVVFGWQIVATAVLAMVGNWLAGFHGALSAALGGCVALTGGLVFMLLTPQRAAATPWDSLGAALRAEGAKVVVIVIQLWLVMTSYKQVVFGAFIGTFTVAVIIFSMAIFVRNPALLETGRDNVN